MVGNNYQKQARKCEGIEGNGLSSDFIDAQSFSNSFEGVHGVVKKSGWWSSFFVFYCIFMLDIFKVFLGGT